MRKRKANVTFADLTTPEQSAMIQLAQQRTTSVVALAADLWRTTPDWKAFDPYPLLTFVLDSLSARGLVTFRVTRQFGIGRPPKDSLPTAIRLTHSGWALMGYARYVPEVGTSSTHRGVSIHTTDMTNYRNHHPQAQGGAIEVDDFATHRINYPFHIHMYEDIQMSDTTDMTRQYTKVTPEIEAAVIHARQALGLSSYADIAAETEVPERTVKYILTELPRVRRTYAGDEAAEASLKSRIYAAVAAMGQIKDVAELRRILGMADDEHSVLHVLHSLHTQGKIDFTERGNGMGTATVINIRLPKRVKPKVDPEEKAEAMRIATEMLGHPPIDATGISVEVIGPEAIEDEAPQSVPQSAPESDDEEYPLLTALLDRERNREESDQKALAYIEAAAALEHIDPEMARELTAKADAFNVHYPSPIEMEYLRYVAKHQS